MLIQIDGWYGGGKGVLWSLLDSHPEIFVCPVHEYSFAGLLNHTNKEEWVRKKYTTSLRKILAKTEYYKLEKIFFDSVLPIHLSADKHIDIKYETDFYKIDSDLFQKLNETPIWSIESIVEELYKSIYIAHSESLNLPVSYPKYYATMSHAESYPFYKNIPSLMPGMKTIVVKRGIKNIIATRTNRKERPRDLNENGAFHVSFDRIVKRGEIEQISHYFETCENLQEKYPKQFLVVEFNDLIIKTEECMKKICNFLGVDYLPILTKPTRDGKELMMDGVSFIGQENDDYRYLLSENEIKEIDKKIKLYKFHKKPFNPFSPKKIFLVLGAWVKKKIKI